MLRLFSVWYHLNTETGDLDKMLMLNVINRGKEKSLPFWGELGKNPKILDLGGNKWRHDIQHNDTQHKNIQHTETQHRELTRYTEHKCHLA